ncbi:hypothetical protein pb186bvf_000081 [Paramecium bursaria]
MNTRDLEQNQQTIMKYIIVSFIVLFIVLNSFELLQKTQSLRLKTHDISGYKRSDQDCSNKCTDQNGVNCGQNWINCCQQYRCVSSWMGSYCDAFQPIVGCTDQQ